MSHRASQPETCSRRAMLALVGGTAAFSLAGCLDMVADLDFHATPATPVHAWTSPEYLARAAGFGEALRSDGVGVGPAFVKALGVSAETEVDVPVVDSVETTSWGFVTTVPVFAGVPIDPTEDRLELPVRVYPENRDDVVIQSGGVRIGHDTYVGVKIWPVTIATFTSPDISVLGRELNPLREMSVADIVGQFVAALTDSGTEFTWAPDGVISEVDLGVAGPVDVFQAFADEAPAFFPIGRDLFSYEIEFAEPDPDEFYRFDEGRQEYTTIGESPLDPPRWDGGLYTFDVEMGIEMPIPFEPVPIPPWLESPRFDAKLGLQTWQHGDDLLLVFTLVFDRGFIPAGITPTEDRSMISLDVSPGELGWVEPDDVDRPIPETRYWDTVDDPLDEPDGLEHHMSMFTTERAGGGFDLSEVGVIEPVGPTAQPFVSDPGDVGVIEPVGPTAQVYALYHPEECPNSCATYLEEILVDGGFD